MSKAFTKDDAGAAPPVFARRAPLPPGVSNYVTPRGLELLREELRALAADQAALQAAVGVSPAREELLVLAERRAELEARLTTAELVDLGSSPPEDVRFGAEVTLHGESGADRCYRIVGIDEADAGSGAIAFISPLARALLGKRTGDVVNVRSPGGEEEFEVLAIRYERSST